MDEWADRLESTEHLELADSLRMTAVESGEKVGRPWYDESSEVGALSDESAIPSASCSEAACTLEYSTSVLPEDLDFFSPQIDEDTSPPCRELSYSDSMPYLTPLPDESTSGPFTESSTEQSEEVEELQESTELSSTDSSEQLSGSRDLSFGSTALEESDQSSFQSRGLAGGLGKGLVTESILSFDALVERECVSMDEGGITRDSIIAPSTENHKPETTRETSQVLTEKSSSIDMGSSEDAFGDKADIPVAESPPSPSPKTEFHTEQDAALSAYIATADMTRNMTPSPPAIVPPPQPLTPTQANRASRATADGDLSELISKKTVLYASPAYQYEPFEVGDSVSEEDKTIDTIQQDAPTQESASAETNGEQSTKSSDFTDVVLAQEKVDVVPAPVDSDENPEEERQPVTITIRMPRGEDYVELHKAVVEPSFQPPNVPSSIRHTIPKSETLLSVPEARKLQSKGNEESRPTIAFISPSTSYYAEDFGSSSGHVVHPTAAERFATEAGRKARGGKSAAEHVVYTFHQKKQRSPSSPSEDRVVQLPDPVCPARRDKYVLEQKSTIHWLWFCLLTGFFFPFCWLVGGWFVGNKQLREWYRDDRHDMADRQAVKDEAKRKNAVNSAPLAGSQQVVLRPVAGQTPAPGRLYQCRRVPSVLNACTSCHHPYSMAVPRITTHSETPDMPASDTQKGQVGEASTSCTSVKDVTSSGGDELEPGHLHSVLARSADQQSDSLAVPTHRAIRHRESHSTLASTSSTVMTAPSARSTETFCPRGLSPEPGGGSSSVSSLASECPPQQVQSASPESVKGSEPRGGNSAHHPSGDEDKTDGGSIFYSPGCGTPLTTVPSTHNPQLSHHALADAAAKLPANFTSASAHGVDKETGEDPGWTREAGIKRVKKLRRVNKVAALVGFSLYIGIGIGLGIGFTHHAS
ncbi:hypothetical protein L202_02671 [Cryptococcus amylolentus CBS 6039]|uniref:Uncharacterized protein n=2 Tax=Cryptococcus amylolentus TaxID=104669 RepID=A0A1E3HVS8_9TREE|nr:hypothetical protein L202_02671 [Cryptococcus amylolentus CBS 6039]ODN80422.1 hypothetical protein L202_02671 [Cryptococcus amylolentus CBS 6039]